MKDVIMNECGRCGTEFSHHIEDIEYECGCGAIMILNSEFPEFLDGEEEAEDLLITNIYEGY